MLGRRPSIVNSNNNYNKPRILGMNCITAHYFLHCINVVTTFIQCIIKPNYVYTCKIKPLRGKAEHSFDYIAER